MKKLFPIIAFVISLNSFGQLPEYLSNVNDSSNTITELEHKFQDEYPLIISFSFHSFWNEREEFNILAYDGENWKIINWSYKSINYRNPKINRERKKTESISEEKAYELIGFFKKHNLFTLDMDSLNWNKKYLGDGTFKSLGISDGTTNRFEFISSYGRRSYSVHQPDTFQDFIYIKQRENFIECRNKFLELFLNADNNR